ncbi:hypothetical protein QYE76_014325 [Lolium multiflorum]|uniref:Zinc finger LSD1-type domain-containing protein n=1 Tax=Lolium multiflorum TaxID=4521 RepID=A0AAD8U4B3_LOLMU|nr:hypothetical protein QYE76_014325 [Lolium multiflorum]
MPVPLAPYPTPPVPFTPPTPNAGAQSQLVCSGCRNLLMYPAGAPSVCCAVCSTVTTVPAPGTEMAQLVCGGCHTLLMESGCACKLRELPNAADVPVRRKVCQMCSLQFCDISWGITWYRPEAQQLKFCNIIVKAASQNKDALSAHV